MGAVLSNKLRSDVILKLLMRRFSEIHKHPNMKKPQKTLQAPKLPPTTYYVPSRSPLHTIKSHHCSRKLSTSISINYLNSSSSFHHDSPRHIQINSPRPSDSRQLSRTFSQNMLQAQPKFSANKIMLFKTQRVLQGIENQPSILAQVERKSIVSIEDSVDHLIEKCEESILESHGKNTNSPKFQRKPSIIDSFYDQLN